MQIYFTFPPLFPTLCVVLCIYSAKWSITQNYLLFHHRQATFFLCINFPLFLSFYHCLSLPLLSLVVMDAQMYSRTNIKLSKCHENSFISMATSVGDTEYTVTVTRICSHFFHSTMWFFLLSIRIYLDNILLFFSWAMSLLRPRELMSERASIVPWLDFEIRLELFTELDRLELKKLCKIILWSLPEELSIGCERNSILVAKFLSVNLCICLRRSSK